MDVGIVIVNYNTRELLRRCLDTLFASEGVTFGVCVVDNASTDESVAAVSPAFPQVAWIANVENVGYPAANNQGLRQLGFVEGAWDTAPRYALLLNPDTEVPPDALARMAAFMDAHPDVGAAGPRLVRPDGSLDKACRRSFPTPEVSFYRMTGLSRLFPHSPRFGKYNLTYLDEYETAEVDAIVGAYMQVRREVVQQVGVLDETFFMYGEDLDWAYRIKAAGWKIFYYPEVTVLHVKRAASRQNPRAQVEFWRAMEIFYRRYYAASTPRLAHGLIIAAIRAQMHWMRWRANRLAARAQEARHESG